MSMTVADRVERGAAWLDVRYPGWWKSINLATLDLSNCHTCMLGQVYTSHIPDAERNELIAQVVAAKHADGMYSGDSGELVMSREEVAEQMQLELRDGGIGGYNIMAEFHELPEDGAWHGFLSHIPDQDWPHVFSGGDSRAYWDELDRLSKLDYEALLDEWTRVILRRRLAANRDEKVLAAA